MASITTNGLRKDFKGCRAIQNLSVNITGPCVYGLIGRNGAGKTTFLKMIAGLENKTSGTLTVISEKEPGVLIEEPGLYRNLSARDNLIVKIKMLGSNDDPDVLLDRVGLSHVALRKAGSFSLGMKQRLGIALSLIASPDILLLDEPINGLDPEGIVLVRKLIEEEYGKGKLVILSSHLLDELQRVATRYGILNEGVLTHEFTREELESRKPSGYSMKTNDDASARRVLSDNGILLSPATSILIPSNDEKANEAIRIVLNAGIRVEEFKRETDTLEDLLLGGAS